MKILGSKLIGILLVNECTLKLIKSEILFVDDK